MLSPEAIAALHSALANGLADRDPATWPGLKDALRQICGEAKLKNWPPESFLISFKSALDTVPAVRRLPRGPDRDDFVARLVSQCIKEFYG
jgi:hypothetical protein